MSLPEGPNPADAGTRFLGPEYAQERTGIHPGPAGRAVAVDPAPTVVSHLNELDNAISFVSDRLDRLANRIDAVLSADQDVNVPGEPGGMRADCDLAGMILDHTRRVLLIGRRLDALGDRVNL